MAHYYGFDYGTTTSLLYEFAYGKPNEIARDLSAVGINTDGEITCYGGEAVFNNHAGVAVEKSPKNFFIIDPGHSVNGVDVKTMIRSTLKHFLENQRVNLPGCHITLTVPNLYTGSQYTEMHALLGEALREITGMENGNFNIYFLPEPVAAALYYVVCCEKDTFTDRKFVVCDIGGGTTDLTIVSCTRQNRNLTFRVVRNQQSNMLGGNDLTSKLASNLGLDEAQMTPTEWNQLDQLKKMLSQLPDFAHVIGRQQVACTRQRFEGCIQAELGMLGNLMNGLRDNCGLNVDGNWRLLRVGGTCRIPAVQRLLQKTFLEIGGQQTFDAEPLDIFYSVAQGAAIFSAYSAKALKDAQGNDLYDSITIESRTPHDIFFQTSGGGWEQIVPQNAPDGTFPVSGLRLIAPVIVKSKKGDKYKVGQINLREGNEKMPWPDSENIEFDLCNRRTEDIRVTLQIEIRNSRMRSCSIVDETTRQEARHEWR